MATNREKVNQLADAILEQFNIKKINLGFIQVDVKEKLNEKIFALNDSEVDTLIKNVKEIVNEK